MLTPHYRKDAQFGEGRRATENLNDTIIFVGGESMLDGQLFIDLGFLLSGF